MKKAISETHPLKVGDFLVQTPDEAVEVYKLYLKFGESLASGEHTQRDIENSLIAAGFTRQELDAYETEFYATTPHLFSKSAVAQRKQSTRLPRKVPYDVVDHIDPIGWALEKAALMIGTLLTEAFEQEVEAGDVNSADDDKRVAAYWFLINFKTWQGYAEIVCDYIHEAKKLLVEAENYIENGEICEEESANIKELLDIMYAAGEDDKLAGIQLCTLDDFSTDHFMDVSDFIKSLLEPCYKMYARGYNGLPRYDGEGGND